MWGKLSNNNQLGRKRDIVLELWGTQQREYRQEETISISQVWIDAASMGWIKQRVYCNWSKLTLTTFGSMMWTCSELTFILFLLYTTIVVHKALYQLHCYTLLCWGWMMYGGQRGNNCGKSWFSTVAAIHRSYLVSILMTTAIAAINRSYFHMGGGRVDTYIFILCARNGASV